jgi:uncharacterized protein YnzC (UPF0291/DUF896 family)
MEQKKLERINELARKAKTGELTVEEQEEQKLLRQEYIQAYRDSLRAQLENMVIVDKDGNRIPVKSRKQEPKKFS